MPSLSNNSVSVRGRPPSYQRDQVDNEAAPASSGMRMRQRGRQSETRGLTLGSVLSAGQTRSQARRAANSRTRLRSVSSVQRNKGDFRFSMARSVHLGTSRAKSRHGPSARAVIRITVLKKKFVALSGMVSLHANPVNPPHHYISRPALGQRTEDRYHTRGHARPSRTALHPLRTRVKGAKEHALAQIGGYLNHSGGSSPGCSGSSRSSASATACNVRRNTVFQGSSATSVVLATKAGFVAIILSKMAC